MERAGSALPQVLNFGRDLERSSPTARVDFDSRTDEAARSGSGPSVAVEVELVVIDDRRLVEPDSLVGLVRIEVVGDVVGILGHRQAEIRVVGDREGLDGGQGDVLDQVDGLIGAQRRHGDVADPDGGRAAVVQSLGRQRRQGARSGATIRSFDW